MSEPLPVSQIIGTIAVPQAQVPGGPIASPQIYPDPPNLHWGLVLLFGVFTCGLFNAAWSLVQAAWMKRVAPSSTAIYYYIAAACALLAVFFTNFQGAYTHHPNAGAGVLNIVYGVLLLIGRFSLRNSLEQHYNSAEPIGLALSGVMTFFFADIYFQYHFNDIVRRKNAARTQLLSA
jgi:hypothetical protein